MLKIKNPELAFAIRYNENPSKSVVIKDAFFELVQHISKQYPTAKLEGINTLKRVSKKKYEPIVEACGLALTKVKVDKRNLICVGVSDKYDISFETESSILKKIEGKLYDVEVSEIPVFDLEKDIEEITKRLALYFAKMYPMTSLVNTLSRNNRKSTCPLINRPKVEFHSTFVRVGNQAMTYESYRQLQAVQSPQVEVTEQVTVPGKPSLLSALGALLS